MLPKAHLTSHSRMSNTRWVTAPSLLSGSLRPFLYSSVYFCTSSSCRLPLLDPYRFCPLLCRSLHEMFPWYLSFLEEIFTLSHFIVFLPLFSCFTKKGLLISPCYSLALCIHLGLSFPFPLAFSFSSFLSYLQSLLRQPLCLLAFLFLWDCFGHCLLCNIMNLHPWFFRHSVYQI